MYKKTQTDSIIRLADGACIPADPANTDYQAYLAWAVEGHTPEPVDAPTLTARIATNTAAIQRELDLQAQARGYDNIVSACSYAAQASGAPFQAEGAAFLAWRSQVWSEAYAVLARVEAGEITLPTEAEAVAQMPALMLP